MTMYPISPLISVQDAIRRGIPVVEPCSRTVLRGSLARIWATQEDQDTWERFLEHQAHGQAHGHDGSRAVQPTIRISTPDAANLLDGIVSANLGQMRRRKVPPTGPGSMPILRGIQSGRVRYDRADPDEHWQTWDELIAQLAKRGGKGIARGDCEDLSSAVVAEMIYAGEDARTYVYKSGGSLYHVVVWTKKWGLLDPSRAAGMGGDAS